MNNYGVSRKDDYKHFINMFLNCETLEQAHCTSAHIFGIQKIQHFRVDNALDLDNIKTSAYLKEENISELDSHSKTYKERRKKEGVTDRTLDKMIAKAKHEESIKRKEELINRYIKQDKLIISEIKEIIPSDLRTSILTWISNANMNTSKIGNTEFGKRFKLYKEEGTCILHCEDGDISMPKYILEFDYDRD